ncbi:hypothetical protein GCM10023328_21480 [Modestobacter marinus]|uniref:Uncharacterized protein n=1 Tax=Modestobacter marinus TaxID=477641 RepID=A0ABQ2FYW3_9ACTN|nr:hypothetical protein GCM10011589_23690 [Modestobacter marinus]
MEGHLGEVLAQPPGGEQVQQQEGQRLQQHAEQPEDDGVEQRPAESAGRVRPDGGERDRALAEEAGCQRDAGVDRAFLVDVLGQVAGGEQVESEGAHHEQQDADAGVGDGVADAGQHRGPPSWGTAER